MKFSLITPERPLVDEQEITDLIVPAHKGELNILKGHAPLLTHLSTGILRYKPKGDDKYKEVMVTEGYCEVFPEKILVLSEVAEFDHEIDKSRAIEAFKKSEDKLSSISELSPEEIETYQKALKKARFRKELAQK